MTSSSNNNNHHLQQHNNRPQISDRIRTKLIETISLNRVTIVVGPTGSGKSTQIPPLLLDGLKPTRTTTTKQKKKTGSSGCRILCSQPRRLAVVAIAKRIAEERGVVVGGKDVGYHVGNYNCSMKDTQLVCTTAGILLEELRNNGIETLSSYDCIIIDECHERSPESDLVLTLMKKFMQTHSKEITIRLVLMSATFNHKRYTSYFQNVPGCTSIDTITLETAESFTAFHNRVTTYYLDTLPCWKDNPTTELKHQNYIRSMRLNPMDDIQYDRGKNLSPNLLSLIDTLVSYLHSIQPNENPFLIFAPTYRHLEQLYNTLYYTTTTINNDDDYDQVFELSVLHSAVDIEDCLRTMLLSSSSSSSSGESSSGEGVEERQQRPQQQQRRILLASAIADSSVTIPGVTCVIDLCRALEVRWDMDTRNYVPQTVWCSKSIADQRKGRTGRTCAGQVFRLVHQGFYIQQLPQWDIAQLQMSACHNEVLAMVCSDEKLKIGDPHVFFRQCLDPPPEEVIYDAIDYLVDIGACHRLYDPFTGDENMISPTDYGSLVSALPLSVAESRIVLEGGRLGLLHESLALTAIYNHKPSPVVHHFGDNAKNQDLLESFYSDVQANYAASVAVANLSAYLYWDSHWHQKHNERNVEVFATSHGSIPLEDIWKWSPQVDEEHMEWCKDNEVNPTSMRSVTEIIECTMNVLYTSKYEPEWLRCADPTPLWKRRNDWKGHSRSKNDREMLDLVYGRRASMLCDTLTKLAVGKSAVGAFQLARDFLGLSTVPLPGLLKPSTTNDTPLLACVHFLMGKCVYGSKCRHSHSPHARRPPCRFFLSGACTKGGRCIYAHEEPNTVTGSIDEDSGPSDALVPVIDSLRLPMGPRGWFQASAHKLFLLGEGGFQFTKALMALGSPPLYTSTHIPSPSGTLVPRALTGVDATQLHLNPQVSWIVLHSGVTCFAWNFPYTGKDEDPLEHEALILNTLQSLIALFRDTNTIISLALTLQGDQWSRWNVTRSMWRTGWRLKGWSVFDYTEFPGYHPSRQNGDKFPVDNGRLYCLEREIPTTA